MAFCPNCGANLPVGSNACPNCGTFLNAQPQQPQYNVMPPNMVYVKPKIPGRGAGIASMVLAIIGLVYSFYCFILALGVSVGLSQAEYMYGGYKIAYGYNNAATASAIGAGAIVAILFFSVLSILGLVLGYSSRKKGYRTGVSMSGLVMGTIGTAIYLISIIMIIAA